MSSLLGACVAFITTLGVALWIASTWERRERARRTLVVSPTLAYVELAFEPFLFAMFRILPSLVRYPHEYGGLAVLSLLLVLSGRAPTSLATDEELAEIERAELGEGDRRMAARRAARKADEERDE